jgi:hypothetical protein
MREFISWDDFPFPTVSGKIKHVPNHQPDPSSTNVEASYNGATLKWPAKSTASHFLGVWIKGMDQS